MRRAACGAALSAAGGRPVRLACGHIFCEDCVAEWMQRERTCPLCRSIVRTSREHVGGDGATTLLPTVFLLRAPRAAEARSRSDVRRC